MLVSKLHQPKPTPNRRQQPYRAALRFKSHAATPATPTQPVHPAQAPPPDATITTIELPKAISSSRKWPQLKDCMYCNLPLSQFALTDQRGADSSAFRAYLGYRTELELRSNGFAGPLDREAVLEAFREDPKGYDSPVAYRDGEAARYEAEKARVAQRIRQDCMQLVEATNRTPLHATDDHLRPDSLGGERDVANLFRNVCQTCNSERGNVPFIDYVLGYGGRYVQNPEQQARLWGIGQEPTPDYTPPSVQCTYVRDDQPNALLAEHRQTSLANAFMSMMLHDVRDKVGDGTSTPRSVFIATLPNMLWYPGDETRPPSRKELQNRLTQLFTPIFEKRPNFFVIDPKRAENYLNSNKQGFRRPTQRLVNDLLETVILPMRRQYRDGERRVGQEDASPGANLRWLRRLHTSPLETPAPRQQAPAPTHDASTTAQPPSSWPHALKRWSWKIVTLGLGSNNQN
ncbi:MAG: hypothetical protein KC474_00705 [Cyanobacteria bacterium HKST-UBA04]|nr:hypothetical protein [Cyanobacteria bacterium HKST-UBA04]